MLRILTSFAVLMTFAAALAVVAEPATRPSTMTCAFLSEPSLGPVEQLAREQIAAIHNVRFVERQQIDAVLTERKLASLFAADQPAARVSLGDTLKADLLILLHRLELPDQKHGLQCVVCETASGLRLVARTSMEVDPLSDSRAVVLNVAAALAVQPQKITTIISVPPLRSSDFSFAFDSDGAAYARLIEQWLLDRPGVVVSELAEATAIAGELNLHGLRRVNHAACLFILGSYQNRTIDGHRRLSVHLTLTNGKTELASVAVENIAPPDAAAQLRSLMEQLLRGHMNERASNPDPIREAGQLVALAHEKLSVGAWEDARSLCEASLLLVDDPYAHLMAADSIRQIYSDQADAPVVSGMNRAQMRLKRISMSSTALAHLEYHLDAVAQPEVPDYRVIGCLSVFPPDQSAEVMLRVLPRKLAMGVNDSTIWLIRAIRWNRFSQCDAAFAYAVRLADEVANSRNNNALELLFNELGGDQAGVELKRAVAQVAASSNPQAQALGRKMQAQLAAGKRVTGSAWFAATKPDESSVHPVGAEFRLIPINTHLTFLCGWQSIDPATDLFWNGAVITGSPQCCTMLLRDGNEPRELLMSQAGSSPVFDGKYLWAPENNSKVGQILVLDPTSNQSWTLGLAEGLLGDPISRFAGAAIAPGQVCAGIAIKHGRSERTVIAMLTLKSSGQGIAEILAGSALIETSEPDPADALAGFRPLNAWIFADRRQKSAPAESRPLFVLSNGRDCVSLPIPPAGLPVVAESKVKRNHVLSAMPGQLVQGSCERQGRIYSIRSIGSDEKWGLYAAAVGDTTATLLNDGVPRGQILVTESGVYVLAFSDRALYFASAPEQRFVRLNVALPKGRLDVSSRLVESQRFGVVVLSGEVAYQLTRSDGASVLAR